MEFKIKKENFFLDQVACKLATSRYLPPYLPSLAETDTMYARGAHSLEVILPDGWTLRSGDGAEELTSGVATKGEESPLLIRATQEEQYPKAVSDDYVELCFQTTDVERD